MSVPIDPTGLISQFQNFIFDEVINKYRSIRADHFLKTFIEEVSKEHKSQQQSPALDTALRKILTTSEAREALFEAYRKVNLSASKELGPKIIALITAKLVTEERLATEDEESILNLAEEMRDSEFIKFCLFFEKENLEEHLKDSHYNHLININDFNSTHFTNSETAHLPPTIALGKWAGKLEKVGFLYTDTISNNQMRVGYKQDVQFVGYHFSIVFDQSVMMLYQYVRRAHGPNP